MYPDHCIKGHYIELDSGSRFYDQRQTAKYCDSENATMKSSDWTKLNKNGPNWYRVTGRAGTRLATNQDIKVRLKNGQNFYDHCGARGSGYLVGDHPKKLGETKSCSEKVREGNVCFDWNVKCEWSSCVTVTNCGVFYVYKLPDLNCTKQPSRYCTI